MNLRLENLASDPVLLPVWMMAYRYGDRVYRFLMNGQTGKSTGEAPLSWRTVGVVAAIALVVIGAVVFWSMLQ